MIGRIESIQVGKPDKRVMPEGVRVDFRHPFWTSAIFKDPVAGPVMVGPETIEGDGQADLENHGGPDNVVLAYNAGHYPAWLEQLADEIDALPHGAFGENFTVSGFSDETVCVGDIWEVGPEGTAGNLTLQITQPRQPCYKLARRLQLPHIVKMVRENSRGGWYLRVLRPGVAQAGMPIRLVERKHPEWTIAHAVQVMYARKKHQEAARALAQLAELSARWKDELILQEAT